MNNIQEKIYRAFQMYWLVDHGITMDEIFHLAAEWRANETEDYSFESYLEEHGFQGSIYPCADEFLGAEYQMRDYIRTILPDDNDYVEYLKDIGWLTVVRKEALAAMGENGSLPIIRFWSNGCGELHHFGEDDITEEELPPELKPYWEEYICDGYVYLVNFPGSEGERVNGIALTTEYGVPCEFSGTDKEWDRAMAASLESAFADVIKLSAFPEFQDAKVYLLEESGFDSRHELFVAFRASTEVADASISVDELKASILLFYKIMTA